MKIIYLHGFASTGHGAKARALRERFGEDAVRSPDLPIEPREVVALVDEILRPLVEAGERIVVAGTSLGGFYAAWFSQQWGLPCVLVNPSMAPSETVGRRIGSHVNFGTGLHFEVEPAFAAQWKSMESAIAARLRGRLVSVFLAQDDEVLPYAMALRSTPPDAYKHVTPDGGHRYELHWSAVMDRIAAIARPGGIACP